VFDVGTATEDALEVDPAPLDIYPHVKEGVDAVQLVLPRLRLLLKLLHTHQGWLTLGHNVKDTGSS